MTDTEHLTSLSRDLLVERARAVGLTNPEAMTRPELVDEILRRTEPDAGRRRLARGWFGVARDLVASMVEQGLNLPDAAALIRGDPTFAARIKQPVATVTLAEIYAAQGHLGRALKMLDEVLALEPDHRVARSLRDRIAAEKVSRGLPTEPPPGMAFELPVIPLSPLAPSELVGSVPPDEVASVGLTTSQEKPPIATTEAEEEEVGATTARSGSHSPEVQASAPFAVAPGAPARLARDTAVFTALHAGSYCVYWEVEDGWREVASATWPDGHLALAVLLASPHPDGARLTRRELPVETPVGAARLDAPRLDVAGCAAIGWRHGHDFSPLVVAKELGSDASVTTAEVAERARAALGFAG